MKIIVKVKTKVKVTKVERLTQPALDLKMGKSEMAVYKVSVKEVPVQGKANEAVIKALAEYFDTAKSNIILISGLTSKQKIFEIN